MKKQPVVLAVLLTVGLFFAASVMPQEVMADNTANAFNTYTGKALPTTRAPKGYEAEILKSMGGKPHSIIDDTKFRPYARQELYPCLTGTPDARHEILVLLDFAAPASRELWDAVRGAVSKMPAGAARVVLFGKCDESYAIDLTGLAIWAARERPNQAMDYVSWALKRWDEIKAGQKKMGKVRTFRNEYDAVLSRKDYPMVFTAMSSCFNPAVPEDQQSDVARYVYDAGNVNMYQATEVCAYYGVQNMPALVVDGVVCTRITADELAARVR